MSQVPLAPTIGLVGGDSAPSSVTVAISAAATRFAYVFQAMEALTLAKVKFLVSAVSGTLGANDIVCDLYDFAAGAITTTTAPNTSLESRNTVTSTPTGLGWVEVTGFTTALTASKLYALVIRNANATPATNNFTIRYSTGFASAQVGSGAVGWRKMHSTDSGATYGSAQVEASGIRLEGSGPVYVGIPVSNVAATGVGDGVYSGHETGGMFTTPADTKLRVKGLGFRLSVTGTPTGTIRGRLYSGSTPSLVASTDTEDAWHATNTQNFYFSSVQVLAPSTIYRITLAKGAGDANASGNRFNLYEYGVENDANSKALLPLGGWVKTNFDGTSTWTDSDTLAIQCWLILDTDDPFASSGFGGTTFIGGSSFTRASSF